MEEFKKILERMQDTAEKQEPIPATQASGLTKNTGNQIGQSLPQPRYLPQTVLQRTSLPSEKLNLIKDSKEGVTQLTKMLSQCWNTQKKYGQELNTFETWESMFQVVLADQSVEEVEKAMQKHIRNAQEIPTPADIISIIDKTTPQDRRNNKLRFDAMMRKCKDGGFLMDEDRNWLHRYENGEIPTVN